jgi:hypothetical protein
MIEVENQGYSQIGTSLGWTSLVFEPNPLRYQKVPSDPHITPIYTNVEILDYWITSPVGLIILPLYCDCRYLLEGLSYTIRRHWVNYLIFTLILPQWPIQDSLGILLDLQHHGYHLFDQHGLPIDLQQLVTLDQITVQALDATVQRIGPTPDSAPVGSDSKPRSEVLGAPVAK